MLRYALHDGCFCYGYLRSIYSNSALPFPQKRNNNALSRQMLRLFYRPRTGRAAGRAGARVGLGMPVGT